MTITYRICKSLVILTIQNFTGLLRLYVIKLQEVLECRDMLGKKEDRIDPRNQRSENGSGLITDYC